jgi:hypothetical protein
MKSQKKIAVIYSIGIRCHTESILKRLNLVKFSSIFGSMNIKKSDNFIKCISNLNILFEKKNLVYTKNIKTMDKLNEKHGARTLHTIFDNLDDYHSSTIAHHDLSNIAHINHFKRGLKRLEKIKKNKIPILFVQISHETEFNNSLKNDKLIKSIINSGFENMFLLSIYMFTSNKYKENIEVFDNCLVCCIKIDGEYGSNKHDDHILRILKTYFDFSNLITKNEIDNL